MRIIVVEADTYHELAEAISQVDVTEHDAYGTYRVVSINPVVSNVTAHDDQGLATTRFETKWVAFIQVN